MIGDLKVAGWAVVVVIALVAAYKRAFGKQLTL